MAKPRITVGLVLIALTAAPLLLANTDRKETACQDPTLRLSSAVPGGPVELLCTIQDVGEPVTIVVGRSSERACCVRDSARESYELAVEGSDLPSETKQLLRFMLVLWGQL